MAELQITLADGRTQGHRIGDRPVVIGREATCDIWLDDLAISRRHAVIDAVGGEYHVGDLNSSNGTWLNGVRITSSVLHHGDVITIKDAQIRFSDPGQTTCPTSVKLVDEPRPLEATTVVRTRQQPSIPLRRLEMIYELSGRLTSLRDAADLLEDAMDICFETFRFERGAIAIRPPGSRVVDWPVARNLRGAHGELTVSRTILGRALDHGERCVVNENRGQSGVRSDSIAQLGIRSAMCVPLNAGDQVLGAVYGDRVSAGEVYSTEDVDFLYGLAGQVSIGLINSRLMEEQKRKLKLEGQIKLAREIQQFLFPAALPDRDDLKAAAFNEPGERISGDYYDVIRLDHGRTAVLIADVTGKGIAASLLMANLQGTVRATLTTSRDPAEALALWNTLLCSNTDGYNFITCLLGILDPASRTLQLATAGHPPPCMVTRHPPGCRAVDLEVGLPLGVDADASYRTAVVELATVPCAIFLYTDGVTEALNAEREEFGHRRLLRALNHSDSLDPQQLIRDVREALESFAADAPQNDDITMLAVRT